MRAARAQKRDGQLNGSIFTNCNYMLLFLGGLVSRIGNGVHYIGVAWYVLERSGSAVALGTIMMVAALPGVVLGPLSGVLVDRLNRKGLIVWMDLIRGLIVVLMGYLVLRKMLTYPLLLFSTCILSICGTLFNPAISATIPNLVKDHQLNKANSLENFSFNFSGILGAAVGGLLIGLYGVAGAFFVDGISFLLSAISEMFIQIPRVKRNASAEMKDGVDETDSGEKAAGKRLLSASIAQDLVQGVQFVVKNRLLFSICISSILLNFFFVGALGVVLPYAVKEIMGYGEMRFGLMDSFFPAGAIAGSLLMMALPEIKKMFRLIIGGLALHGILLVLIGVVLIPALLVTLTVPVAYGVVAGLMILMGVANVVINVPVITLFQRLVPDAMRGRFFAMLGTFSQGLIPLAYFVSGVVLGLWAAHWLVIIGGCAVLLVTLWMGQMKEFHNT